jgi:hypothetical protein
MNKTNRFRMHNRTANRRASHRAAPTRARRPSDELIADAVVASYIHDISRRHREGTVTADPPR